MRIIIILLMLNFISKQSDCQSSSKNTKSAANTIKTNIPCSDEVLFKTPGRWLNGSSGYYINTDGLNFQKGQINEVTKRIDALQQILQNIYPQPMGIDAVWHRMLNCGGFAERIRYGRTSQGTLDFTTLEKKPVAAFGFVCGFFPYGCNSHNPKEIWPGYPGETGTWLSIFANSLTAAIIHTGEDEITINGYPVCTLMPLIKKFGDFGLLGIDEPTYRISTGGRNRYVIIHRKGILPYIPVTRKQYLENCIPYTESFWDKSIKALEEAPMRSIEEQEAEKKQTIEKMKKDFGSNPLGLKQAIDYYLAGYKTEQEIREEQVKKSRQDRDEVLKKYREELEKTTKEGLLDAPAIVQFLWDPLLQNLTIFTDEKNGWSLVIQNPEYMRKDLPKYVPQLFVVQWKWNDWPPQEDIAKLAEEKFPFDKLQEMIDK